MKKKRKVNKGRLLIIVGILCFFLYNIISVEVQYYQLKNQKKELELQLSQEKDKLEQLDNELTQMESEKYIEMLARKYFGLVYPEEKVIIEVEPEVK